MWQELSLVHGEANLPGAFLWRTCIRQVNFLPPGTSTNVGEIHRGAQAHRFLVEVCSGLHSPLLGETEVFGQFRSFRQAHHWHPAWIPLLDAVEEDVKKLRRDHLTGLGAQSYGSLARKHLPAGEPVVIVGAGNLAKEMAPWLLEQPLILLARDPKKLDPNAGWWKKVSVLPLTEAKKIADHSHWIIAAPMSNEELLALWSEKKIGTVLDLRGEGHLERSPSSAYYDLGTLFGELEIIRSTLQSRREQALLAARKLSQQREVSVCHRPFGWEDAFA